MSRVESAPVLALADSIVYLAALLADRRRPIDRYIDYFGEPRRAGHRRTS